MNDYGEQQINLEPENVEQQIELEEEPVIINQGGTQNYNELRNKPSINNVELVGNKTSQDLSLADDDDINNLQSQIDAITVSSDVVDVLGTYQDLLDYDTSELGDNDIVKVLQDSTHGDAMSYYRWDKTNEEWVYVGSEGPFYTKSESNTLLNAKANTADLSTVAFTGKYKDLIDNPTTLLNVEDGYTTLTTLLQNLQDEEIDFANYEAENNFSLEIGNESGDFFEIYPGDIIKISALYQTAIIITSDMMYRFAYNETDELWSDNGDFMTSGGVSGVLSHYVTITSNQDITGTKTIRANNGLRFRYGGNYVRMSIKPISTGMAIAYFDSQGNEANNMEFSQGYNTSNKHFIPKDDKTQNLGKSDKVWNNAYIDNLTDGTNSITVENIVGKQDALTFDNTPTVNSTNPVTSGGVYNSIQNVIEVAEGKTATYTLAYSTTGNEDFNSQNDSITVSSFTDTAGNVITDADVKVGDIVLIVEVDVPDRWVQSIDTANHTITFYKMETSKIDLNNYVDLTSAQEISGSKTFTSAITMKNNSRIKYANSYSSGCSIGNDGGGAMRFFNSYNTGTMDFTGSVLRPATASINLDLGTSSVQWRDLYLKGNLSDGTNSVAVNKIANKDNFVTLSQADYDALATKDPDTFYFIEEE